MQAFWRGGAFICAALLTILLSIFGATAFALSNAVDSNDTATRIESSTETVTKTVTATEATSTTEAAAADESDTSCPSKFRQVEVDHSGNMVDADFQKAYAKATAGKNGEDLSDAQRQVVLSYAAKRAEVLSIWAHSFRIVNAPSDFESLIEGDCLSSEGQVLFHRLEGALTSGGVKFDEDDAPSTGFNSGVARGEYAVAAKPGISGDRKSIKITWRDDTMTYIMVRCANPVFPRPPEGIPQSTRIQRGPQVHVKTKTRAHNPPPVTHTKRHTPPPVTTTRTPPPVTTTHTPPPVTTTRTPPPVTTTHTPPPTTTTPPPTTPPTTTTPPPTHTETPEPKSSKTTDYKRPGDGDEQDSGVGEKPPAPAPTWSAETNPPEVETQQPGGGGVTDAATKEPESESGVTAPEAEAPAPSRTNPPPPATGANDGDNSGNVENPF